MKLGVVIFPTQEVQDLANSYRMRYDPNYKLVSPHLTLKEAFHIEGNQLPEVITELTNVASGVSPFTLSLHKVSHFHPTNNVIYIAVEEEPRLRELFTKLHEPEILRHERQYAFVPHVTIGQQILDDELHDIYSRLRTELFDFKVEVESFHLVYQREDLTWHIHQTFNLGENA